MYAAGQDPRLVLQARGPRRREGDADRAHDRPSAAAAVPEGLAPGDAARQPHAVRGPGPHLRRAGDERRVRRADDLRHPVPDGRRRGADRQGRRQLRRQPDRGAAAHRRHGSRRGRHRRGRPDGRVRRQRGARGRDPRRARHRAFRDQEALRRAARAGREGRQAEAGDRGPEGQRGPDRRRSPTRTAPRSTRRRRSRTSWSARPRRRRSRRRCSSKYSGPADAPEYAEYRAAAQLAFDALEKHIIRQRIAVHKKRPDGRSEREIRADHDRRQAAAAHARLGAVHARPDAGAERRRARHHARGDAPGQPRARDVQALLPPLQLPAVLRRRGRLHARPEAPRHRPRRARRARAGPDDPGPGDVPVHDPRRVGHPRVQRLVLDGVGLRLLASA